MGTEAQRELETAKDAAKTSSKFKLISRRSWIMHEFNFFWWHSTGASVCVSVCVLGSKCVCVGVGVCVTASDLGHSNKINGTSARRQQQHSFGYWGELGAVEQTGSGRKKEREKETERGRKRGKEEGERVQK